VRLGEKIEKPGVYPPEAVIEPEKFLKEVIENDIPLYVLKDNTWEPVYIQCDKHLQEL